MYRFVLVLQLVIISAIAFAESPPPVNIRHDSSALVIGFVGGFVRADNMRHSEVQLARKLQTSYGKNVIVQMFENRRKALAHQLILDTLRSQGASMAGQDNKRTTLILYGHSWGASAVVSLARELEKDHVPVALTIQVDSIEKNGEDDSVIPANVAAAINFYQARGFLHGRREITAADPSRTHILGNFLFTYTHEPAECRDYPWYNRLLFKGHTSIECDTRVWSQIETLIRMQLPAASPPTPADKATTATASDRGEPDL